MITITSERSQAYGRVMKLIEDLGPTKLHNEEIEVIRTLADTLLFSSYDNPIASVALRDAQELCSSLSESGRWMEESADILLDDLRGCGGYSPLVKAIA